jgi:hypothetical protein
MSEDKARQGGALGWKTRQDVVGAFADAAFKLGVSTACAALYWFVLLLTSVCRPTDAHCLRNMTQVGEMTQAPVKTQFGCGSAADALMDGAFQGYHGSDGDKDEAHICYCTGTISFCVKAENDRVSRGP